MTGRMLWHNGSVHAPQYPFATAIEFADGVITWIGDADTAKARMHAADEIRDLAGGVVLPGFVDIGAFLRGGAAGAVIDSWRGHGIVAGSVLITATEVDAGVPQRLLEVSESPGGLIEFVTSDDVARATELKSALPTSRVAVHITRGHVDQAIAAREQELPVIIDVRGISVADVQALCAAAPQQGLAALTWWAGVRWIGDLPDLSQPGILTLTWLVEPDQDAAQGLNSGINTVIALLEHESTCDPWQDISIATRTAGAWSGRAIVRALSRSAWRMWGDPECGELDVGQRATLAVWQGSSGAGVVAPRGSLASWSAEAQSGMPVLPVSADGGSPSMTYLVAS